jgi:hypothetical protein
MLQENDGPVGHMDAARPRPQVGSGVTDPESPTLDIEIVEEIARRTIDRDGTQLLAARLAALDAATERAAELLSQSRWTEAMLAWTRVSFAAEAIFGTDDAAVLDAMRITASIMRRLDLHQEAITILCDVAERTLRSEGPEAPRLRWVRAELEAARAGDQE